MKNDVWLSFYLRSGRIRVHRTTVKMLNGPRFIRFLISTDGKTLLVQAYDKKDFRSLRIRFKNNIGGDGTEVSSKPLCELMAQHMGWQSDRSYRIPGKPYSRLGVAAFDLTKAEQIGL